MEKTIEKNHIGESLSFKKVFNHQTIIFAEAGVTDSP
jgi:hypothetical protein